MERNFERNENRAPRGLSMNAKELFVGVAYGSKMVFQSVGLLTQISMKRRKAISTFKKTLMQHGISPEITNEIAKEFPNPISEIFSLIRSNISIQNE